MEFRMFNSWKRIKRWTVENKIVYSNTSTFYMRNLFIYYYRTIRDTFIIHDLYRLHVRMCMQGKIMLAPREYQIFPIVTGNWKRTFSRGPKQYNMCIRIKQTLCSIAARVQRCHEDFEFTVNFTTACIQKYWVLPGFFLVCDWNSFN